MKATHKVALLLTSIGFSFGASAQVLDLQTGRSADLSREPTVSLEAGGVASDYDYIGTRANFKVSDKLLLMADLGVADIRDDELALGVDAMYQLGDLANLPLAIKAGAAFASEDDADLMDLSAMFIISGDFNTTVGWYANAGLHYVDYDSRGQDDDDVAPVIGGGILFDISESVEAFVAADALLGDIYDDVVVGGGIRFNL